MSEITMSMIKELRERTGAGIMDCKAILKETDGDMDKAVELLRKKRADIADKKAHRDAKEGMVGSYLHVRSDGGVPSIGVMAEVNCETDFAAKTDAFKEFVNNLCLHIAAASPRWKDAEEIPEEALADEKKMFMEQLKESGKPENILEKIVEGKMKKWYSENCLLEQIYALAQDKSEQVSIAAMMKNVAGTLGENVSIRRFVRFDLTGE
jgi:elongation factor Ts